MRIGLGHLRAKNPIAMLNQSVMPVAIDFGAGALKLLQVAGGDPPTLIAAAAVDTPDDLLHKPDARLEFQLESLPRLLKSGGFKGKRAACSIPSADMFCQHLRIQRADGVSMQSLVDGAVCSRLEVAPGSMVLRHVNVCDIAGSGKSEVLCFGAHRSVVARLMQSIRQAHFAPVGMQCEHLATLRSFEYINRRTSDHDVATLYVDIGASTTKIFVAHALDAVFAKSIEFGGHQLNEAVSDRQACTLEEARRRRLARGPGVVQQNGADNEAEGERRSGQLAVGLTEDLISGPAASDQINVDDLVETLTDELSMCIRYYQSVFEGRTVSRIIFVGGEARDRALCEQVARALRLPAQIADPMARVARTGAEPTSGVDFGEAQPGWSVALGLCLSPTDL